ncbi:MAG: hypothetical protein MRQ13_00860 [Candidatus Midichloria sp.]|nr:hypothetical protein [Candidatus Midichloria sp.]
MDEALEATYITRPRRWGKTTSLDMLRTFLEVEVDEYGNKRAENSNKVLFTGGVIDIGANNTKN